MAKASGNTPKPVRKNRPAISQENRMQQMVAMTLDVVEEQLQNRTASSQVMTYFLKYGAEKTKLEAEKLRYETELIKAKKTAIDNQQSSEELFAKAIKAFGIYSGRGDEDDEYDYDY